MGKDLAISAGVSAFAVALASATPQLSGSSPLFLLSWLALSFSGHFALDAMAKAGLSRMGCALAFVSAVASAWLAVSILSGSASKILSFAPLAACLCAPAAAFAVRDAFER
ncbi:MAG: hypothetical protein N3F07_01505 [Candidatus Micrarchaeota archaeon]|nr:hypothetical protein [Candidatus Micrarchaeota archaeon]